MLQRHCAMPAARRLLRRLRSRHGSEGQGMNRPSPNYGLILALLLTISSNSAAAPVTAKMYDFARYSGSLQLRVDHQVVGDLSLTGAERWVEVPPFELTPRSALQLRGSFSPQGKSWWRRPYSGTVQ